jgi:hypothetical protein
MENWENNDAYLTLVRLLNVKILIKEYKPIKGSSYIETPKYIANKKATINIKKNDNKCFKYCILYGLFPDEIKTHPERILHYKKLENKYPNLFNLNNIPFPVKVEDVKKFSDQNENINVFHYDEDQIYPLVLTPNVKIKDLNLLLIGNKDKFHYIFIKDLSKLISSNMNNKNGKKYICERCLCFKYSEEK